MANALMISPSLCQNPNYPPSPFLQSKRKRSKPPTSQVALFMGPHPASMLPHAQHRQHQKASIAPSMAQNSAEYFSTLSMFGINPLQTSPNLIGKSLRPDESGVLSARQSQVGGGESAPDFSTMRKRGRDPEAAAAAAGEEEVMAPTSSFQYSNVPMDKHQRVFPAAPNGGIPTGSAGTSPSCSLLCFPADDPDSDLPFTMRKDLFELDLFLSAQMERVRAEMEQRRRRQWAGVARAVEDALQRVVRDKDEEIASVARRNSALEERVGVLAMEGQMWRALARTNEAAAAALRRDIELARQAAGEAGGRRGGGAPWADPEVGDSVSCCEVRREEEQEEVWDGGGGRRRCRVCRRAEVSTLVLPCRHLCLCGECDAATAACPLCGSQKSASIKVHLL
ncbi:hypothetical protein Taro_040228 [Colocasia esculenta]|uniref:RING-type domain-containing protein n=1 Tax=Colocasia esculenta TaxID=4460 RepID=A0A843WL76_COLES|nr:hypothetical protein [Colocasia esculenta]